MQFTEIETILLNVLSSFSEQNPAQAINVAYPLSKNRNDFDKNKRNYLILSFSVLTDLENKYGVVKNLCPLPDTGTTKNLEMRISAARWILNR